MTLPRQTQNAELAPPAAHRRQVLSRRTQQPQGRYSTGGEHPLPDEKCALNHACMILDRSEKKGPELFGRHTSTGGSLASSFEGCAVQRCMPLSGNVSVAYAPNCFSRFAQGDIATADAKQHIFIFSSIKRETTERPADKQNRLNAYSSQATIPAAGSKTPTVNRARCIGTRLYAHLESTAEGTSFPPL